MILQEDAGLKARLFEEHVEVIQRCGYMYRECAARARAPRCIESVALQKWFSTFHSQPLFKT